LLRDRCNAGQIYFPAGAPNPTDEETGVKAAEAAIRRSWTVVFAPWRIACMKLMTLPVAADKAKAKARIDAFHARDPHAHVGFRCGLPALALGDRFVG
jgi:hypothetical protein